ncbi:MAG: Ig-like domain-containing protein, partial [Bacteroidales bacterium]|nr:Ig-like domain-containing protein [Bacteroidales bacterium]
MRKFLSFCVFALFATASFSQYSIKMERMEADGQIYYQGELPLKSYVDDAEDGFLPALNTAYVVDLKNLTTNTQMGKLQVNIVDRAESNGWWTEVNPTYKVLGEDITPSDAITQEAKIFVMNLGDEPEAGKYTLIFHAWGVYENVDEVTLTIEDLSMATLVDMYLEETSLELSTGETSDVKSLVRYSLFEETETDKYPLFSSSNPKVVEIDENGVITAVAPGTATITITTLGKLLTAIDEYEAGSLLTRENELQVTVSLKPNVVFAWNSYGTDVEGVGEEGVSDYWQYSNTEKIPDALDAFESGLASTWTASEGDSFTIHIKGVSKVTGTLDLVLVDQRQEVNNWGEMSDFERSIAITEGEEFDITKTMEIKYFQNAQGVSYAMPDFIMEFSPSNGSEYGKDNTVDFSLTTFDVSYTPAVEIATPIVENTEYKYCKNAKAVALEATATENGVLVWYDSNNTVLESAPTPSTENVGTQVFYVSQIIDEVESAKKAINVTINDLPSVYISGNSSVKAEESFTLTAVAYSSFGIDSYSWTIGDEASEETSENVTTSLSSSTKVAVTVTDNESCSSTAEQYVTVFSAEPPVAVFAEDEYTVEVGETITITPSYTAVDDFSNLSFLLKEYNGCVQFETKIDGTCAVSGLAEGSDSLILNLTYSNGVDTYKLNDTCKIIVVPSQKVPQPKVNKTEYVYCQYDEPEAFAIDVTEGTTLQWYDKTNGEYVRLYNDPVVSTDYAYNAVYAVSQVRDGLESAKVEISIVVNARPALEVTY